MASFSRAQEFEADGIGVGIAARAKFDPYGASRFLTSMERNAALKAGKTSLDPRAQDFLSSHPATPERVQNAQNRRGSFPRRRAASATARPISPRSTTSSMAKTPAKVLCAAAASCIRSSASPSPRPETFTLDNTAQAVIGVREGGTQAMRFDVVRVPSEQSLGDYLNFRLDGECRQELGGGTDHQRLSRRRPRSRAAISGSSRSMRCASAATSTASSLPPSRRPPRATATPARPSIRSAA